MSDYPQELLDRLPTPVGYKILIAIPEIETKQESDGGIVVYATLQDASKDAKREEGARIYAYVLKIGPDAYANKEKFPNGPWCREGDFILMRAYSGTRFKLGEQEFRLINDDTVEATVPDPTLIKRAY